MDHVNDLSDALPTQALDLFHVEVCKTQNRYCYVFMNSLMLSLSCSKIILA